MPTDLLLPAFVLTLLANTALVAVAVRGLVRARAERDRQDRAHWQRDKGRVGATPNRATVESIDPPAPPAAVPETAPPFVPTTPELAVIADPVPAKPRKPTKPPLRAPATPATPNPADSARRKRPVNGDNPVGETRRGGRRRFSLPHLDEDHERVNRSIKTFLSGSDSIEGGEGRSDSTTIATTVAVVAIDGLDRDLSIADQEAVEGVVATLERTLREAARSADRVTPAGIGRFRVVLPATGELAARTYLRRVRATLGPSLEGADAPLSLVTATATVLDDSVAVAVAQAEARLDAALAGAARRTSGEEPRVAHD
jgi:hypothetical protein